MKKLKIIFPLEGKLSDELPEWTATQGEWEVVRISYLFRVIFFIFAVYAIYWLLFKEKTKKDN